MGRLIEVVTPLHKSTKRDYIGRMTDDKVACMEMARKFEADFWDGDRRYGYGGYKYDGRWEVVARRLIEIYDLKKDAKILDIGCGKGFLLFELKKLLPDATVKGFDISGHGIANSKEEVKQNLFIHNAHTPYPFEDDEFDLAISFTTLHNLRVHELKTALKEMERVAKNKFLVVESYRNEEELFNLQCWALTCESFFSPEEWIFLFDEFEYSGDYEFIFF